MKNVIAILLLGSGLAFGQIGTLKASMDLVSFGNSIVPYQNGMPLPAFEKQPRTMISLAGQWKEQRFAANHTLTTLMRDSSGYSQLLLEAAGRQAVSFDDATWPAKALPGVENKINAYEKVPEYYENGVWYRRSFTLPDSLKQQFAQLVFYSVNYVADVWLNNTYLGWHEGGFTPFSFDVSSLLRTDTVNVISVRVDNIPWGTRSDIVPFYTCDWFNYTGIIHDTYLEFSNPVSVVRTDLVPKDIAGNIQSAIVLRNSGASAAHVDVSIRVYSAKQDSASLMKEVTADVAGTEVTVQGTVQQVLTIPADSVVLWNPEFKISNPQLWSPLHPNLYVCRVTVKKNGTVTDDFFTQFGVRTFATSGDRILLNGKQLFLHGVARHEDHPTYGRSLPLEVIYSDLKLVKNVNANYLRTAHYPNHPYTYLVADRLGLVVMEEIPVWWFDSAAPWGLQNIIRKIHLQMFREMAFRDYNRPSIAMWSLSNESKDVSGRSTFFQMVQNEIKTQYPDGRLIMQSSAADRPGAFDPSQEFTDVAGWTMYFGIFYDPYKVSDYFGTKYFLIDAHDFFPNKPIFNTEYGNWSSEARTRYAEQTQTFDSCYLAFKTRLPITETGAYNHFGFLAGITWWCIFDWYSHQNPQGFQSMGLMQMNRIDTKPVMKRLSDTYKLYVGKSEYISVTSVDEQSPGSLPTEVALQQNYPNPFNPETMIRYALPQSSSVRLSVHDILGREVAVLVDGVETAGLHDVSFRAKDQAKAISSGVYFYTLRTGNTVLTRKMLLVR